MLGEDKMIKKCMLLSMVLFCASAFPQYMPDNGQYRRVAPKEASGVYKKERIKALFEKAGLGNLPEERGNWINTSPKRRDWMIDFEKAYKRLDGNRKYLVVLGTGPDVRRWKKLNEQLASNNDIYYWLDKHCVKLYIDNTTAVRLPEDQRSHNYRVFNFIKADNRVPNLVFLDKNLNVLKALPDFQANEYGLAEILDIVDPAYARTYRNKLAQKESNNQKKSSRQKKTRNK